ncbi:hypothetical protein Vi05172_g1876 [Venturia inaequalis]|nr:hypothetical protein Vi05172_g1876 [Venturia inaequalis]
MFLRHTAEHGGKPPNPSLAHSSPSMRHFRFVAQPAIEHDPEASAY